MSKKPRNTPHTRQPNPAGDPAPNQPAQPKSSEISGNERIIQISELTFRQQSVLPTLAVSRSLAQAARDTGVAESTLRRWLQDPGFREELQQLRRASGDLARQQAEAVLPACLAVIAETALEGQDPALRFRAARYLISYATKLNEMDGLRADLKDLTEAIQILRNANPLA